MKNLILISIILSLCDCTNKAPSPSLITGYEGRPVPSINLLLLDSTTHINAKSWKLGMPLVLIDISPYCPYCRAMTQEIIEENKALSNIQFIFLSNFPLSDLNSYYKDYRLKEYPNITIARDYASYFGQYFKFPGVPCIAIYGKERLLKQVFVGKTSPDIIKDIVLE